MQVDPVPAAEQRRVVQLPMVRCRMQSQIAVLTTTFVYLLLRLCTLVEC